jgi:hypothetical protein
MPKDTLRYPDAVRDFVARRYRRQQRNWLAGDGRWPLSIPLGCPSEEDARSLQSELREWVDAWRAWSGPGAVTWTERRWRTLGAQRLPESLVLQSAAEAAFIACDERRWDAASRHAFRLAARWPVLATRAPRWFDELAALNERDIATLEALLAWLESHPKSGLFPRQLPIPGMDTKWMEPRLPMVADLLDGIRGDAATGLSMWERCGLRQAPATIRMRILDPVLRSQVGGLSDIAAPLEDLRALALPVDRVYVVENLQTGLAFQDRPGAALVMGLGYGVSMLADIPWIAAANCIYWGDIDTHGFAILSRARACLPRLQSILMDESTLLRYRELWVREAEQVTAADVPFLTDEERALYRGLKEQRWGSNIRLEQERIAWDEATLVIDSIHRGR